MSKMTAADRLLESLELIKVVKSEEPDEVDLLKLVDQDGVECLFSPEDCGPEQEEHESGVDWNKYNEDEGEDR